MTARTVLSALVILVAASALTGCASGQGGTGSGGDSSGGAGGSGSGSGSDALSIEGEWRTAAPDEAWLRFDADGGVTGSDGCNGVGGTATVEGDEVSFALDPSTLKACVGVTVSFSKLGSAVVDGDVMTTRAVDGGEIVQLQRQ
ncbi:META domain-containing protein [Herbiconiux sp. CPCC 205716]|uniref:META domain-containing protein n=1 Tax=Herbiconiux gentiana TaxID=2970912 RepID=A0ABT2GE82_9MICO|nr:META domain-containing protein [Herbiconiux gentiana]MCS5714536.1 META domain-containing protein [Herbiconiux gentiana]